jgi:hypothetical protein
MFFFYSAEFRLVHAYILYVAPLARQCIYVMLTTSNISYYDYDQAETHTHKV